MLLEIYNKTKGDHTSKKRNKRKEILLTMVVKPYIQETLEENKKMPDVVPSFLKPNHYVVVTQEVTVETPDEDVTISIRRGIYPYSSWKEARRFTTLVNAAMPETEIAHLISRNHKENDNE